MFRGFELDISGWQINSCLADGKDLFDYYSKKVAKGLDIYLNPEKVLDAEQMKKDWFPQIKAEVFISHSHADEDLALSLAGWLHKNFGIRSFIDSMVWGYADKLLKEIDDEYCKNKDTGNYIYKLRNYSTSHLHIMLSASLNKMIDKTECFFFINTPNSISTKQSIEDPKTYSPWIYSEIETSRLIKNRTLEWHRGIKKEMLHESMQIEHTLNTEHLHKLNKDDFELWKEQLGTMKLMTVVTSYPLDLLYTNCINKNNTL